MCDEESPGLVGIEDTHLAWSAGKRDARQDFFDQPPADRLLERGMKNGIGVWDGSRREAARVHLMKNALDVERRKAQESALTKRGANGTGEQRLVVREGLISQLRPAASSSQRFRQMAAGVPCRAPPFSCVCFTRSVAARRACCTVALARSP